MEYVEKEREREEGEKAYQTNITFRVTSAPNRASRSLDSGTGGDGCARAFMETVE